MPAGVKAPLGRGGAMQSHIARAEGVSIWQAYRKR
jgi:hypothetical protein